jgi:hypothetical protein
MLKMFEKTDFTKGTLQFLSVMQIGELLDSDAGFCSYVFRFPECFKKERRNQHSIFEWGRVLQPERIPQKESG